VFYKQPWHQILEQAKILIQEVKLEENFTLPIHFQKESGLYPRNVSKDGKNGTSG